MPEKTRPILELSQSLTQSLDDRASAYKALLKHLRHCTEAPTLDNLRHWAAAQKAIAGHQTSDPELAASIAELDGALRDGLAELRAESRAQIVAATTKAAAEHDVAVKMVGQNPLVLLVAPLLFEADFATGRGVFSFGKERLPGDAVLEGTAIVDARDRLVGELKKQAQSSAEFFRTLHAAYQIATVMLGTAPGDRVDLVDLLVPLSMARSDPSKWRTASSNPGEPYPRYLFAFQLWLLRRDRMLSRDGVRLDLGAATGGSTRNKRDVLFVPSTPVEGQYYGALRFVPATTGQSAASSGER